MIGVASLRERIVANAVLDDLESLVRRINVTNLTARRDQLAQRHALLQAAAAGSRKEPDRYGMREIKWLATMEGKKLQQQSDDVAKSIRELNARDTAERNQRESSWSESAKVQ